MVYNDDLKFVFVSNPKCGTHTFLSVLKQYYHATNILNGAELHMHKNSIPPHCKNYFIFSPIRNPYERAVSGWWSTTQSGERLRDKCPDPDDFTLFWEWGVKYKYHPVLYPMWFQIKDLKRVDYWLNLDLLPESFYKLPFYNNENIEWPRLNQTFFRREDYRKYYTQRAIDLINDLWKIDFDKWNFPKVTRMKELWNLS